MKPSSILGSCFPCCKSPEYNLPSPFYPLSESGFHWYPHWLDFECERKRVQGFWMEQKKSWSSHEVKIRNFKWSRQKFEIAKAQDTCVGGFYGLLISLLFQLLPSRVLHLSLLFVSWPNKIWFFFFFFVFKLLKYIWEGYNQTTLTAIRNVIWRVTSCYIFSSGIS